MTTDDPRSHQRPASTRDLSTLAGRLGAAWDSLRGVSFSPGVPLVPTPPKEDQDQPRRFQFPVGINTVYTPRGEYPSLTPFGQLQALAESFDVAAMCIAVRIEEIQGLDWTVAAKDKRRQKELQGECDALARRFAVPDGSDEFDAWISALLYDVFTIDALTIFPRLDLGGRVVGWEPIDGATIKPILDEHGKVDAYQQVLYGTIWGDYTRADKEPEIGDVFSQRELIYRPRWRRNRTPYGFPPSEWIILRVNQALRKQSFDLAYFTEGNTPDALAVPKGGMMTPEQVRQFEEYFNTLLAGNDQARRKMKFLPFEADLKETRSFSYDTQLDDWLMRVCCAAYGVPPNELGFTDAVNKASAQVQETVNERRGLRPITSWMKDLFDRFVPWMGERPYLPGVPAPVRSLPGAPARRAPELSDLVEFRWVFGEAEDRAQQATIDKTYVDMGAITAQEVRAMRFANELDGSAPPAPPAGPEGGERTPPPAPPQGAAQGPPRPAAPAPAAAPAARPPAPQLPQKTALAKRGVPTSAIVGLFIPEKLAGLLIAAAGAALPPETLEAAGDLHLTLCRLGDVATLDGYRPAVAEALALVAAQHPPVIGEISGVGVFTAAPGDPLPVYASVDAAGLIPLRLAIVEALAAMGLDITTDHAFDPHITLAYVPADVPAALPPVSPWPVQLPALTLAWAGDREEFPLGFLAEVESDWRGALGLTKAFDDEADEPPDAAERQRSERRAAPVIARALLAQQAIIAPALDALSPGPALADPSLWAKARETFVQLVLPLFVEILTQGAVGGSAALDVAIDFKLINQVVLDLARREASTLAAQSTATSEAQIARIVADWVASGEDRAALRKRVREVFANDRRAQLSATTSVTKLFALGNQESWRASGLVEGLKIRTAVDERVCKICGPKHNLVLSIGAPPEELPPFHPGCRCWVVPTLVPLETITEGPGYVR